MPDSHYYVAIDFGSESMAACYIADHLNEIADIDLQAHFDEIDPDARPLTEADGRRSKRLRTRIAIQSNVLTEKMLQDQLSASMTAQEFVYFHREFEEYTKQLLPNPKLLYQAAITSLLPASAAKLAPEQLLHTIVYMILRHFVFGDPGLVEDASRHGGLHGSRIHLILTVPNVYSISHVSKLRMFIKQNLRIGGEKLASVETVYESDAIAHYLMYAHEESPVLASVARIIERARKSKRHQCNVVTIDVGRGTTDVGFATYEFEGKRKLYDLKARTGRAHGGARLTYLIARTLDERIGRVYERLLKDQSLNDAQRRAIRTIAYRLLNGRSAMGIEGTLIAHAEEYIDWLKKSWDEHLVLTNPAEGEQKRKGMLTAFATFADDYLPEKKDEFLAAIDAALTVPEKLPSESAGFELLSWFRGRQAPADPDFVQLAERIREYVRMNADDILDWMEEMAIATESVTRFDQLIDNNPPIVIVAGQAGQFRPLREALRRHARERWNVSDEDGGGLVFLNGSESKYACCHGAVMQHRVGLRPAGQERVMGTYAFLDESIERNLTFVDMHQFRSQAAQVVPLDEGLFHWFVFQPRYFAARPDGDAVRHMVRDGGSIAYLWSIPQGGDVTVTNQGENGIHLKYSRYGKVEEQLTDAAAFADVREKNEFTYARTWPEVRPLAKEE